MQTKGVNSFFVRHPLKKSNGKNCKMCECFDNPEYDKHIEYNFYQNALPARNEYIYSPKKYKTYLYINFHQSL